MQDHIRFDDEGLHLLDQRHVPSKIEWVHCTDAASAAAAIRDMVIRGAPAIGITAAYGMALAARNGEDLDAAATILLAARPTAVNLRWAVEHMQGLPIDQWDAAARDLHTDDIRINQAIGMHGASLLPEGSTVYTHCNAGALATGGWGTALGVVRSAWQSGRLAHVFAGETRPYLQGARLTAWECEQEGIPCTLVTDSTAASLMAAGKVDAVVVGADRVAANGDVANKIGTLGLAVLAKHYRIPFYVAVPHSTLDPRTPSGDDIPIEERDPAEVRGHGGARWAADVDVFNPAFDITPAALVSGGWITEQGPWHPPHEQAVR
jgi:methylthioribose-1-phosphate isomerase